MPECGSPWRSRCRQNSARLPTAACGCTGLPPDIGVRMLRLRFWLSRRATIVSSVLLQFAVPLASQELAVDDAVLRRFLAADAPAPSAAELPRLLDALTERLASPDPAVRDDLAFALLAKWIVREAVVPSDLCARLFRTCQGRLRHGIGEQGSPAVAGRSFAALTLSLLAARDLEAPFLDVDGFAALFHAAVRYLDDEVDVRGLDARLGWLHSVAHTADLLKFLARSRHLTRDQQAAMLDGIARKVAAVPTPWTAGEDERLARAVLSLCARDDFDREGFRLWLAELVAQRSTGEPLAELAHRENRRHLLVSLFALLAVDRRPAQGLAAAMEAVRQVLGG